MGKDKKPANDDDRHEKIKHATRPLLLWFGFLQQYRLTISFTDDLELPNRPDAVASIADQYPYRAVELLLKRSWVDKADEENIQEIMIHEILHILLFSPVDRYLQKRGLKPDQEYVDLQEVLVELPVMWIMRFYGDLGKKTWEL